MKTSNAAPRSRRSVSRFRKSLLAGALSVAFGIGSAHAQAVVEVGPNLFQNIMNQINTLTSQIEAASEYATQATRWTRTLQQFRDMVTNLQDTITALGLPNGVMLKPVKADFMVVERCGDGGGFTEAAMGVITEATGADSMKKKQAEVCTSMQRMQNKQYNEMVEYMTVTMKKMDEAKSALDGVRGSSKTPGEMNGAIYKVQEVNVQMERAHNEFMARMKAYDTYLAIQKDNQGMLSETTMRGKPSIVGQVMKTAALKTALSVGN